MYFSHLYFPDFVLLDCFFFIPCLSRVSRVWRLLAELRFDSCKYIFWKINLSKKLEQKKCVSHQTETYICTVTTFIKYKPFQITAQTEQVEEFYLNKKSCIECSMVSVIIENLWDWWLTILPYSLLKAKRTFSQFSLMFVDFNTNR